jgi:hypothetical protein
MLALRRPGSKRATALRVRLRVVENAGVAMVADGRSPTAGALERSMHDGPGGRADLR